MSIGHFLDDRESEPGAVSRRSFDPIKALEHLAARIFRDADTVVLDAQIRTAAIIHPERTVTVPPDGV